MNEVLNTIEPVTTDLLELTLRFVINLVSMLVLVRFIYYTRHRNQDFVFTFALFNIVNFLLCYFLSSASLKIGFAFGLFAIFSMLRYRTVTIPVREMGYFFVSVTLGILNALVSAGHFMLQIVGVNMIIMFVAYVLDHRLSMKHENFKEIIYERIDLIQPDKRDEMLDDLQKRTGLAIHRIELLKIDFLKDIAHIHGFYYSNRSEAASVASDDDD